MWQNFFENVGYFGDGEDRIFSVSEGFIREEGFQGSFLEWELEFVLDNG